MPKAVAIVAFLLTLASAYPSKANPVDFYLGVQGGYGASLTKYTSDRSYTLDQEHLTAASYGAYVGIGYGLGAIEGGYLKLPTRTAYAAANDPPRSAHQSDTASALFLRALLRAPTEWTVRPYAFAGAAKIRSENHEWGQCSACGVGYQPDFKEDMSAIRPYVGTGAEVPLFGPFSARAEFGYIPRYMASAHVQTRDLYLGSLAVLMRF